MGDPTSARMKNGQVHFKCPTCAIDLTVKDKAREGNHTVTLTSFGVTVDPQWVCPECGLVGKIRNDDLKSVDRRSIPPGDYQPAELSNGTRAFAVRVDVEEQDEDPEAYPDKDDCPDNAKHGYYGRVGERCPTCYTDFSEDNNANEGRD